MSEKISVWFNNLPLSRKIMYVVTTAIACISIVFFLCIQSVTKQYEKALYSSHAQGLGRISETVDSEMQKIETLSFSLLSDSKIQSNLEYLYDGTGVGRIATARRNIYESLYSFKSDNSYIKSINIITPDGYNNCMGNASDITYFNTIDLTEPVKEAAGRAIWRTETGSGTTAVCARQIRQISFAKFTPLANLYVIVDMAPLIRDSLSSSGYLNDDSDFILFDGNKCIYPAQITGVKTYRDILEEMKSDALPYSIRKVNGKNKFLVPGSIGETGWTFLYLRDYDSLFRNIRLANTTALSVTVLIFLFSVLVLSGVFRHILKHLDYLLEKIRCFGEGRKPSEKIAALDYANRNDEIGRLHRSFDQMEENVTLLKNENYEKQLLLQDATIQMLQQQINPHFLYNTLDTINWAAQKCGSEDISVMARSLGNIFRASISVKKDLIPLKDELSFLDNYIRIQKIRFRDRLDFDLNVPENLMTIEVPKLCIQPLVENAIKYSMDQSDELCLIRVSVRESEKHYELEVSNSGSAFEDDLLKKLELGTIIPQGTGVGLVNIHSRCRILYGDAFEMRFFNRDQMAVVLLKLPKEGRKKYAETSDR